MRPTKPTDLAQALIKLRGEVESLNSELELVREEQRTTLAALDSSGRNSKRSSIDRSCPRASCASAWRRHAEEAGSAGVAGDTLKPVLLRRPLRNCASTSGPACPSRPTSASRRSPRSETQIANGTLPPHRAANRVWAFYEDEFRLTRETGLHKQTIALGDEQVLADVVKVGAMMLYFKTQDGRIGHARREPTTAGASW